MFLKKKQENNAVSQVARRGRPKAPIENESASLEFPPEKGDEKEVLHIDTRTPLHASSVHHQHAHSLNPLSVHTHISRWMHCHGLRPTYTSPSLSAP